MPKPGPIILIEDDADDQKIFAEVLASLQLKNKVHWFTNGPEALAYLTGSSEQPFIIFCDINLPKQTGIEFKKKIDSDPTLRKKSIPFLFYSTSADRGSVTKAYTEMTVQGYFEKPGTLEETTRVLQLIFSYWQLCKHPNS
jgi:CheY-like chemotaxis protein